jgi:tight adherence protein B
MRATTELLVAALTAAVAARFRLRAGPGLRDDVAAGPLLPSLSWPRSRRPCAGPAELASWCDALAREIRSGSTLGGALRTIDPPAGSELGDIGRRLRRGSSIIDATAAQGRSVHERAITTVLAAIARHGGEAAEPLDRVAATLRRRAADESERLAHSSQARLSALVMTVLPVAVLAIMLMTSPSVRAVIATPLGLAVLLVGSGLNLAGWSWMRRVVRGRRR